VTAQPTTKLTVAVAGNPNSGKTTIFNALTGARQRVGNYPGVTVEWKEGTVKRGDLELNLVDLPGTYSLTAYSDEELVARDYLLKRAPDVVVNVVDASSLERNLYLTTELLEIGCPLVVVLNMTDVAQSRGLKIDAPALATALGVPVVTAVGNRGQGMDDILTAVAELSTASRANASRVQYSQEIESLVDRVSEYVPAGPASRWQALKLVELDPRVRQELASPEARQAVQEMVTKYAADSIDEPDIQLACLRYAFIGDICREVCQKPTEARRTLSDRIDRVAIHPVWGLPVFLTMMFLVFTLTFTLGNPLMDLIDQGFTWLSDTLVAVWPAGVALNLQSLIIDGIIGGVGGVIVFLPNIVLLFVAIAVLEGTGYMARAAFVMDGFMSRVGLHGKSFIPLLIGFGCTVPAIMATRTLETRRDRLITMMVLPLMSCGARLPIYALLIPAFFAPRWQGPTLWLLYVLGIILALSGAMVLRSTMFRGETTPFVMELPPYHLPTARSLLVQMWTRSWLYIKKAGTLILGASIILWIFTYVPRPPAAYVPPVEFHQTARASVPYAEMTDPAAKTAAELSYSMAGRVGYWLEPVIRPLGFDWRIGTALIGAIAAKEVFVAQMGIVFAVGDADQSSDRLREQLRDRYSPLVGLCIMIFALISTPCIATFAITRQESGSLKWALAQSIGLTVLAWLITFAVFQGGTLLGLGVV